MENQSESKTLRNPFEKIVSDHMEGSVINRSANKKAAISLAYSITAVILLILGFISPEINIVIILIVCGMSVYYAKKAKDEGATNIKKLRLARVVSRVVSILCGLALVINVLGFLAGLFLGK